MSYILIISLLNIYYISLLFITKQTHETSVDKLNNNYELFNLPRI